MLIATFVSVARAALATRQWQFRLRDEFAARRRAEARARTLAGEMKHRVMDVFAVATSIASQTFRKADTLNNAYQAFSERLTSMAKAQDLITAEGDNMVAFHHLVEQATEPYRPHGKTGPFDMDRSQVLLPARKAMTFAIALHEFANNAAKHNALTNDAECISIRWWTETSDGRPELFVEWRESGGPPVAPPAHRGLGSLLVERALSRNLGGTARLEFDPGGVVCTIRAAMAEVKR
ncbi:sensor histidine kinase [uncultured Jannaschia sp.]|uniref:sensor histidine kinase n=1 Tax=uncultured Jannaschia sp. TaxID=293347 RepID=UPI00260D65E6|nr:sensor histidine kinase [uncultured Jannaschia sp.]